MIHEYFGLDFRRTCHPLRRVAITVSRFQYWCRKWLRLHIARHATGGGAEDVRVSIVNRSIITFAEVASVPCVVATVFTRIRRARARMVCRALAPRTRHERPAPLKNTVCQQRPLVPSTIDATDGIVVIVAGAWYSRVGARCSVTLLGDRAIFRGV
jgi:hypothetical protein